MILCVVIAIVHAVIIIYHNKTEIRLEPYEIYNNVD